MRKIGLTTAVVLLAAGLAVGQTRVGLTRERVEPAADAPCPLLSRELLRQATLIAARRELGLAVGDEVIGEPTVGPASMTLRPDLVLGDAAGASSFALWKDGDAKPLATLPLDSDVWLRRPQDAMGVAEVLSRGPLLAALKTAGLRGRADKIDAAGAVDPVATKAMNQLELLSQLAAVRLIDAQIAADGESPQRLAALARGYANVWQLSWFVWGGASKDFAARALLYGQRAVVKFPGDAAALDGRGYAEALVGLPKKALTDFDAAKAARGANGHADPAPPWEEAAIDLAHYDPTALTTLAADPKLAALANFFALLTVEHMPGDATPINLAALTLKVLPSCVRAISSINDHSGPGLANWASGAGFAAFSQTLSTADTLPGLPAAAAKAIGTFRADNLSIASRGAITDALHQAGDADTAEPSWHALARTIEDVTFMTAAQRVYHIGQRWGVDPSDVVEKVRPLLAGHRWFGFIDAYGDLKRDPEAFAGKLAAVKVDDASYALFRVMDPWQRIGGRTKLGIGEFQHFGDETAFDIECRAALFMQSPQVMPIMGLVLARELEPVAPDAPTTLASKIYSDWPAAEPKVQQWLADTGDHPTLTLALANHYRQANDPAKAAAMYEKYLELSPDPPVYGQLAEMYLQNGDEKKWLATIDECLKQDAPGLENARLAKRVSDYLIEHKRPQDALKYATLSADSGSEWGVDTLVDVDERLGRFDEAEKLVIENGDHYGKPDAWLAFCVRTGHGNRAAADAHTKEAVAAAGQGGREARVTVIAYDMLHGDDAQTTKDALAWFDESSDPWAGLAAWSIAARHHDVATAARVLADLDKPRHVFQMDDGSGRPLLDRLGHDLRAATAAGAKTITPFAPPVDMGLDDRPNVYYFAGTYCESVGNTDAAVRNYRLAIAAHQTKTAQTLAFGRLRELKQDPYAAP